MSNSKKLFFIFLIFFFWTSAGFPRETEKKIKEFCADKGEAIMIEEFRKMLRSYEGVNSSCTVFDFFRYASPEAGNFKTFDGYIRAGYENQDASGGRREDQWWNYFHS